MDIINCLEKDTIVITSYNNKLSILNEINKNNKLYNIKFLTKEELVKKFYFSYDENAVFYLMKNYGIKRDIAEIYLRNMYYVFDDDYSYDKLIKLRDLKKELIDNNLLVFDKLFLNYLKNKKVIFYNYDHLTLLDKHIISELEKDCDVLVLDKEYREFIHTIYEFNNIVDEVEYVCKEILKLIDNGICIDKIKLTNVDSDYVDIINRIFSMYKLSVNLCSDKLISTQVAFDFVNMEGNLYDRVLVLGEKYKNSKVLEQLINILNKYIDLDDLDIVNEMIIYELKNTCLKKDSFKNEIEVIDYKNYNITDDMYVFMLSFNQNKIPVVYKDEDFITDNLKESLLLEDTSLKNKSERESTIKCIKNIKNLVITYKNSTPFNSFFPSNLIGDLGYEVVLGDINLKLSYSDISDKIRLSSYIDNFIKTGNVTDELKMLYSNYLNIPYGKYSNKYTGISSSLFKNYVSGEFNLAYSSMDNFYKCPFKYYLSNVLNLNIYEDNFNAYIGSLFHYVLEKSLKDGKSVDELVSYFITNNDRVLTKKEEFYISKIKEDIRFTLDVIKEQIENSNLKNMLFEDKIEVIKEGDIKVTFKGFVDKIVYEEKEGKMIVAIIDYKTGFTDINLGFVNEGLSMQLPVYLYLAKNSSKLYNVSFAGFYLQKVLSGLINIDNRKSYEDIKRENLLLYGYSNSDHDIIHEFDNTYKDSRFIKSMRLDSKGEFSRFSKILSDEKIDKLIEITDKKIDEAIFKISNASFDISPKKTEKELIGCKFCNFRDICFKENSDEVLIFEDKDLSFLGGDCDA